MYPPECTVAPSSCGGALFFCAMPSRRGAPLTTARPHPGARGYGRLGETLSAPNRCPAVSLRDQNPRIDGPASAAGARLRSDRRRLSTRWSVHLRLGNTSTSPAEGSPVCQAASTLPASGRRGHAPELRSVQRHVRLHGPGPGLPGGRLPCGLRPSRRSASCRQRLTACAWCQRQTAAGPKTRGAVGAAARTRRTASARVRGSVARRVGLSRPGRHHGRAVRAAPHRRDPARRTAAAPRARIASCAGRARSWGRRCPRLSAGSLGRPGTPPRR